MTAFLGRQLPVISLEDAGTFYSDTCKFIHQERVGCQLDCISVEAVTATVSWEFRSHDSASWCPFQVSGATYEHTVAPASATVGPGVATGKLTFESIATDSTGSEITVILADTGTAGAEVATMVEETELISGFGVRVIGRVITVEMDAGTSTAAQIKAALDGVASIAAVLKTTVTISGAMAAGVAALDGGGVFVDFQTSAPQIRAKVVVQTGAAGAFIRPYFVGKT